MTQMVTLSHPKLPGRQIEVTEQSVPHHERAGWRRKTKPKTAPKPVEPVEKASDEQSAE